MNSFFEQIKNVIEKERIQLKEQLLRGEFFNVFEVLGLSANETKTHSAFLAELLRHDGSHGLENKPLAIFLRLINNRVCQFDFDSEEAIVEVERSIGPLTDEKENGGRIDIIIETKKRDKAIIVENKIYAQEQENQLVRYYNYAKKKYGEGNFLILYLCLNAHDASDYSSKSANTTVESGKHYFPIAYNTEIQLWIKECLSISYDKPLIRETLRQYLSLILNLANNMENSSEEIIAIMRKNPSVVTKLLTNVDAYKQTVIENELKADFQKFASSRNLELIIDPGFLCGAKQSTLSLRKKEWKNAEIAILPETKQSNYWIAIFIKDDDNNKCANVIPLSILPDGTGKTFPFGSKWLPGVYRWLYDAQTIEDILSGKFIDEIGKLIDEIIAATETIPGFSDL